MKGDRTSADGKLIPEVHRAAQRRRERLNSPDEKYSARLLGGKKEELQDNERHSARPEGSVS